MSDDDNPEIPVRTAEDYIRPGAYRTDHAVLSPLTDAELQAAGGKLHVMDGWLARAGIAAPERLAILRHIKEKVFADLKVEDIEPSYEEVVRSMVRPEHWPSE